MYPNNSAVKPVFILLFILLTAETPLFASQNDDFERYQKKLERVQQSINKVKKHLKSTRYKRGHVVTELKQLESEISKNSTELGITQKKINNLNHVVTCLRLSYFVSRLQVEDLGTIVPSSSL